jgi:CSLREA domain-containing protein
MLRTRRSLNLRNRKVARVLRVELLEPRQLLATITVNATVDTTTPDASLSLREAIEVSNGTLALTSLSTQEHPHDRPGVQCGDRGLHDRRDFDGVANDQHERGDH